MEDLINIHVIGDYDKLLSFLQKLNMNDKKKNYYKKLK